MFHEVKHEDMWFLVSNMEIQKPSQELHFEVTKKHTCLLFHIHVFNLFKSWWNQGFDQDSNGYKNSKKNKVFLCYIVSIQLF